MLEPVELLSSDLSGIEPLLESLIVLYTLSSSVEFEFSNLETSGGF